MLIPINPNDAKVRKRVFVSFKWGQFERTAEGEILRLSECGRYAIVKYSYDGKDFQKQVSVSALKQWVDGRKMPRAKPISLSNLNDPPHELGHFQVLTTR